MNTARKYQICKIIYAVGFLVAVVSLAKMTGASEPSRQKFWFGVCMADIILTIPLALGFYYYRSRSKDLEIKQSGSEALDQAGKNLTKRKQPPK